MDNEEFGTDAENQEETLEQLKQKFEDQKKRAEKAEAEAKEHKGVLDALASELNQEPETKKLPTQDVNQFDNLADNLAILKPLDTDEVEELRTQARELGVDPIKFAQSKSWKAQLGEFRANKKADNNTPEPSHRVAVFEGKTFTDVVSDPNLSPEAKQQAFEAQRDASLKRGVNNNI